MATKSYCLTFFSFILVFISIFQTHIPIHTHTPPVIAASQYISKRTHIYTYIRCIHMYMCVKIIYWLSIIADEVISFPLVICVFLFIPTLPSSQYGYITVLESIWIQWFYHFNYAFIVHCWAKWSVVISSPFLERWVRTWQAAF